MMKKLDFLILLLVVCVSISAENRLVESSIYQSDYYVYRIDGKSMAKKIEKGVNVTDTLSHTLVAQIKSMAQMPKLERGNYLIVRYESGKMLRLLHVVDTITIVKKEDKEVKLYVYDHHGQVVSDAKVYRDKSRCKFNKELQLYACGTLKKEGYIIVENKGVYHFVGVSNQSNPWKYKNRSSVHRSSEKKGEEAIKSFMVYSKPKYRPGERVQLKMYLTDEKYRPIKDAVSIRLRNVWYLPNRIDTLLEGTLHPYRDGMYSYEFNLDPSLNLSLNSAYNVFVYHNNKELMIDYRSDFKYEDYELDDILFDVTSSKTQYNIGDSIVFHLQALDVNRSPYYGGHCEVKLSYNNSSLYGSGLSLDSGCVVSLPSVLWQQDIDMSSRYCCDVVIPDSAIRKGVSLGYTLHCTYFGSDSEKKEKYSSFSVGRKSAVKCRFEGDSLFVSSDLEKVLSGTLYYLGYDDEILQETLIELPYKTKVPWYVRRVKVHTDMGSVVAEVSNLNKLDFDCVMTRQGDSVQISITNPLKRPLWYRLIKNKRVMDAGYQELHYQAKSRSVDSYALVVEYLCGGVCYELTRELKGADQDISMEVMTDKKVFPGASVPLTLYVTDKKGRPLKDIDVTAYGYTEKFGVQPPHLFSYKTKPLLSVSNDPYSIYPFLWNIWSEKQTSLDSELGMDSLEYYRFIHTKGYYSYAVPTTDATTQVIPYMVQDGKVCSTKLLWIDNRLHYVNYQDNRMPYAFMVSEGNHSLRICYNTHFVAAMQVPIQKGYKNYIALYYDAQGQYKNNNGDSIQIDSYDIAKKLQSDYLKREQAEVTSSLIKINNPFYSALPVKNRYYDRSEGFYYMSGEAYLKTGHSYFPLWDSQLNFNKNAYSIVGPFPCTSVFSNQGKVGGVFNDTSLMAFVPLRGGTMVSLYQQYQRVDDGSPFYYGQSGSSNVSLNDSPYTLSSLQREYASLKDNRLLSYSGLVFSSQTDSTVSCSNNLRLFTTSHQQPMFILFRSVSRPSDFQLYYGNTTNFNALANEPLELTLLINDTLSYRALVHLKPDQVNLYKLDCSLPLINDSIAHYYYTLCMDSVKQMVVINPLSVDNESNRKQFEREYYSQYEGGDVDGSFSNSRGFMKRSASAASKSYERSNSSVADFLSDGVPGVSVMCVASQPSGDQLELSGDKSEPAQDVVSDSIVLLPETSSGQMRHNFNDVAFWKPTLTTDASGKIVTEINYPDDISSWKLHCIAVGKKRNQCLQSWTTVNSTLPLSAELLILRFVIEGDRVDALGKITNYTRDSIQLKQTVVTSTDSIVEDMTIGQLSIKQIPITSPVADSLTASFSVSTENGYFDGERRTIPIYRPGIETHQGVFKIWNEGVDTLFKFDATQGDVTVYADNSASGMLLQEIERLLSYPYNCNEQLASKLKALLAKRQLLESMGQTFLQDKEVNGYIKSLEKNSNGSGLWGWWGQSNARMWISLHVVDALKQAETMGYSVKLQKNLIENYCLGQLERAVNFPVDSKERVSPSKQDLMMQLELLKLLNSDVDYENLFREVDGIYENANLSDGLQCAHTAMSLKLKKSSFPIDSLKEHMQQSLLGSYYWKSKQHLPEWRFPYSTMLEQTAMAYDVMKHVAVGNDTLTAIRNYFYERRSQGRWLNTYQSALMIETLLPDLLLESQVKESGELYLNGKKIETALYRTKLEACDGVKVVKHGRMPLFFTAYQDIWESNPKKVSTENLSVETFINGSSDTTLLMTKERDVEIDVVVKTIGEAQYVQIEVPIPAGCSYDSKNRGAYEMHREYYRDRVVIFCEYLPGGEHHFKVNVLPRYTGLYKMNAAQCYLMYFPTIFSHESMKYVEIKSSH